MPSETERGGIHPRCAKWLTVTRRDLSRYVGAPRPACGPCKALVVGWGAFADFTGSKTIAVSATRRGVEPH